ncbi:MAG: VWA-like domain-containing protein [Sulfurovum sp.]|jgi:predicted metal-dependent peptidase|nr:VWA-like domain-containing protein [Sulfurovum sp.]
MTRLEKIAQAKAKLMLDHPYFGTIASALKLEQSDNTESFLSDGTRLQYNDEYFDSADVKEIEFALANGAMHAVLEHTKRTNSRYDWLWQLATDYTVNAMLVGNGLQLPPRANYQERFKGMYAEEVYEMLRSEIINEEHSGDENLKEHAQEGQGKSNNDGAPQEDAETSGDRNKNNGKSTTLKSANKQNTSQNKRILQDTESDEVKAENLDKNTESLQQEFQEQFEQIFQKLNRQGSLPKDLEFVVPEYFSHKIHWREVLYRYIASYAKSTYAFMPPNMKYLYRNICLPSLSSDLLRIVVAVDTSGSVDESLLGIFLSEINAIMESYPNYEIDLITADAQIRSHRIFLPGEPLEYKINSRGGTDFRAVFDYVETHIDYPTLLLYFTDGYGVFPEREAPFDVFWVMPKALDVPFGEIIVLD